MKKLFQTMTLDRIEAMWISLKDFMQRRDQIYKQNLFPFDAMVLQELSGFWKMIPPISHDNSALWRVWGECRDYLLGRLTDFQQLPSPDKIHIVNEIKMILTEMRRTNTRVYVRFHTRKKQ